MPELKVAVQLRSFQQPFKKALLTAAEIGAKALQIDARGDLKPNELSDTGVRHLRKTMDDLNLRVASVQFFTRRGYNVLDDLDSRVQATKAAMQFAYRLGSPILINHVGRIPDEPTGTDWELLIQVLTELANHGQKVGAMLAATTGSESPERLESLVHALPEGSLLVDLDPGQLTMNGYPVLDAIKTFGPAIAHVQARDGMFDRAQNRGIAVQLGRGSVDFPALLGALQDQDYRGYFTVQRSLQEDPAEELRLALQYLRNL